MTTVYSPLGLSALVDPQAAKERILVAFRQAKTHRKDTAELLGIDRSTFQRLVARLGMQAELDLVEEEARRDGWHHGRQCLSPGRPKGKKHPKHGKKPKRRAA